LQTPQAAILAEGNYVVLSFAQERADQDSGIEVAATQ
jgi:hypothetical protein